MRRRAVRTSIGRARITIINGAAVLAAGSAIAHTADSTDSTVSAISGPRRWLRFGAAYTETNQCREGWGERQTATMKTLYSLHTSSSVKLTDLHWVRIGQALAGR